MFVCNRLYTNNLPPPESRGGQIVNYTLYILMQIEE